jgi:hypothetical protein
MSKFILTFSLLLTALTATSCSTYKYDEKRRCADYKPVCIYGDTTLKCERNKDGCESCGCVSNRTNEPYNYTPGVPSYGR